MNGGRNLVGLADTPSGAGDDQGKASLPDNLVLRFSVQPPEFNRRAPEVLAMSGRSTKAAGE